ncbi:COG1 protein, partial [Polypterus senegalus]|nr:COG1 protein [Polypterus senegalus]
MAAVPAQALRVADIKDPTALFERYSAEEIRGIERKVRGEIEQKKEELRQMVGERYRDLIEAADTIGEMRQCAESVVRSVQNMHVYCSRLKQERSGTAAVGTGTGKVEQAPSQEKFYSMAAQIKLLLEIPERIWSHMEAAQYLRATQLHLLCCYIHGLLQLDSSGSYYSPVLARFPILVRQVAAAGHFRSTILMESRSLLKERTASDQAIAEALTSIMLLEGSSPRQALADFLLARKTSIQQLLNQPQHGAGIKARVCSLVELLATTLYQAYAVFYKPSEGRAPEGNLSCGHLFTTLEMVTSSSGKQGNVLHEEVQSSSWFQYLPSSIVNFQPELRSLATPISQDYLKDTLQQWMNLCKEDIKIGISNLLVFVKSLKGLASIRDAVWELLTSEGIIQHWYTICQSLLDGPLSFWEDFLQPIFLARVQALIKEGLEEISSSSKQLLLTALLELETVTDSCGQNKTLQFEYDIASFLWSETPNDLPSDAAWINVANRSHILKSGLSMKAQALTPCVQNFCGSLDTKLKVKLEDLLAYLPPETASKGPLNIPDSDSQRKNSAFDRYADASTVELMLQEHCLACTRYILSCIQQELRTSQSRLDSCRFSLRGGSLNSVLFMGRLCQSIGELCPNLKQCIMGKQDIPGNLIRDAVRIGRKTGKGSSKVMEVSTTQTKWQELKEELLQHSLDAYRIWTNLISKALIQNMSEMLHSDSAGSILATVTNWEELEIQEESEQGNSITSKIRLPAQPSWYIQLLLFHLCQEVNRVGGHALPKITLQELLKNCLQEVVAVYEVLTKNKQSKQDVSFPMTQNHALQLLFDLRYISMVLNSRQEESKVGRAMIDPRIQQVIDTLESYIDPFDLDVFTQPLNNNLTRLLQRTSVLLGLITGTEKHLISRNTYVNSQEPYNILPLASSQIRFGLLPLSMSSSRTSKSSTRSSESMKAQALPVSVPPTEDSFRPGSLFRQLASQDEEPTTSSLFKLGWLSSMTK